MQEKLKTLYLREIEQAHLNFDDDPEYQAYYTQAMTLWEGKDMPQSIFDLLDTSNFLAFSHGFRLGAHLTKWAGSCAKPCGGAGIVLLALLLLKLFI